MDFACWLQSFLWLLRRNNNKRYSKEGEGRQAGGERTLHFSLCVLFIFCCLVTMSPKRMPGVHSDQWVANNSSCFCACVEEQSCMDRTGGPNPRPRKDVRTPECFENNLFLQKKVLAPWLFSASLGRLLWHPMKSVRIALIHSPTAWTPGWRWRCHQADALRDQGNWTWNGQGEVCQSGWQSCEVVLSSDIWGLSSPLKAVTLWACNRGSNPRALEMLPLSW